jgi:hypothetical protein
MDLDAVELRVVACVLERRLLDDKLSLLLAAGAFDSSYAARPADGR